MFKIRIEGLEQLQSHFAEIGAAMKELDGEICRVNVNVADPADVQRAIREMERAVDVKVQRFRGNAAVMKIAAAAKVQFRQQIFQRARESRQKA